MTTSILPYMRRPAAQTHITEPYVSSPPAVLIVDEAGDVWTLGLTMRRRQSRSGGSAPNGEYAFNVLRNGINIGEFASRIERCTGRVRIFTNSGWKRWSGRMFN